MESLGTTLKQAREGRKLSLSQVAEATRISYRHLQNIEEGRYGDLPGGMYNRAFLRAYSEFLGLDPQPLVSRYDAETAPVADKKVPRPRVPVPQHPSERRVHPLAAWIVMLAASTAGVFFSRHWIAEVFSPYFSRPPAAAMSPRQPDSSPQPTAHSNPEPVRPAPPPPAPSTQISPPSQAPVQEASGNATTPGLPSQPATQAAGSPAPRPAVPTGDASPVQPASGLHIRLSANQKCWASVTADNRKVVSRQLEPGEEQEVAASQAVVIVLGNAGGVQATINGKPARPFGKPGEVVKVILTEQNLTDFLQPLPKSP